MICYLLLIQNGRNGIGTNRLKDGHYFVENLSRCLGENASDVDLIPIGELFKLTISMEGETKNGGNSDGDTSKQFQAFPMQNLEASIKSSVQTATKSNATPVRVQRKRTKGFKLQDASPNDLPVVYVGRPSKWGNPYKINQFGLEECLRLYELYLRYMLSQYPDFLDELKGKDLACWCPLIDKNGNPILCHADIIIKIMKEKGLA